MPNLYVRSIAVKTSFLDICGRLCPRSFWLRRQADTLAPSAARLPGVSHVGGKLVAKWDDRSCVPCSAFMGPGLYDTLLPVQPGFRVTVALRGVAGGVPGASRRDQAASWCPRPCVGLGEGCSLFTTDGSSRRSKLMGQRFSRRRVAVVGAAGGIGAYICGSLHAQGASVYGLDLRRPDGLPAGAEAYEVDVTSESSVADVVSSLYAGDDRPIDLVNSAGLVENDVPAELMPMDTYDRVMAVNLRGVFLTCRDFGKQLLERGGGAIVNVASMSGNAVVNEPQRQSVYNTSKSGVSALTRSLAVEWGGRGLRVNAVSPGYVDTPLNSLKKSMHEHWLEGTVLGRFGTVAEVAGAVEYLLSDEAAYCCGTELLIDGGFSLR